MTWNIKAGQNRDGSYPDPKTYNLDQIATNIKNSGALIVSLQEVDANTIRSGKIHQSEYIAKKLTAITGTTWYQSYITSFNYDGGYYGNAIVSRYPITSALRLSLPKVDGSENRSFLLVRADLGGGSYLYVGTFHLGLNGDQDNHAQTIKDALYINGYSDEKLIIGGDLNDKAGAASYYIMLNNKITMADTGPGGVCTFACYSNPNNPKIDFWFKRGIYVDTSKCRVLAIDISDHRPLIANVYGL